jgi:nitrite reductase/ring-hydroxylating ferredoxin subunit
MSEPEASWVRVCSLRELAERGVAVVSAGRRRVAVFAHDGGIFAVDNRCPHMGFPLERGSARDGILTCHWHQARFDLESGCTFDLWADDVARFDARVADGDVFVSTEPTRPLDRAAHRARLRRGLEQDVALIQAKSLLALLEAGGEAGDVVADVVDFAAPNLRANSEGLIRLGCVADLYPALSPETAYQALLYATRQISSEVSRAVPRRGQAALDTAVHDAPTLAAWLRQWALTRPVDGTERTLLSTLRCDLGDADLADVVFGTATERLYANGGHLLEDCNKIFELTDLLGRERASALFPLLTLGLAQGRGEEEGTNWHHPIEIVEPMRELERALPELLARGADASWKEDAGLVATLLGEDPLAILGALAGALADGAPPLELARRVAYAAALRLARFATTNEVTDWFGPQHTFINANAAFRAVERSPTPAVVRAIFQAAISVWVDRYLNVPPARLPEERGALDDLPAEPARLRALLLEQLDQRGQVEPTARVVARWVRLGHPLDPLVDALAFATVREDLDFHSLQVLEAGARQARGWVGQPEAEHILVGVARNLAAHCPTRRAGQQTAAIALRLHRGEKVWEG